MEIIYQINKFSFLLLCQVIGLQDFLYLISLLSYFSIFTIYNNSRFYLLKQKNQVSTTQPTASETRQGCIKRHTIHLLSWTSNSIDPFPNPKKERECGGGGGGVDLENISFFRFHFHPKASRFQHHPHQNPSSTSPTLLLSPSQSNGRGCTNRACTRPAPDPTRTPRTTQAPGN